MSSTEIADYLLKQARSHGILDPKELANLMGQMQVESGGFARLSENLNYSGRRLLQVFPGRNGMDTLAEADMIAAGGPEAVANAVYGGQWGKLNLGNTDPGDGWKYHGRGYVQLTGRDNYERIGEALGLDLINHPELAQNREIAARIALHYWDARVVAHGHQTDVRAACRDINGGTNGLAGREQAASTWAMRIGKSEVLGTGHTRHGQDVRELQQDLSELGYMDSQGHPLKPDGDFGANTRRAVEAFQRDHHLVVDGKVGPRTQHTLTQALQARTHPAAVLLNDASHPDHALYQQALAGVREIDAHIGRHSDVRSDNLAAALTVEARREGLTRIDEVALNENGERAFAMQHGAHVPIAHVQTADAVQTSIANSSAAWAQAAQQASVKAPLQEVPPPQQAPQAMGR